MLYLSVPELIAEAAKLVPAIKDAGVTATSERLTQLQDQKIVVKESFIRPKKENLGIISDIDDTFLVSYTENPLKKLYLI